MCSSGAYFNIGQTKPKIKLGGGKAYLNDIPVYTGFAAGDFYLGLRLYQTMTQGIRYIQVNSVMVAVMSLKTLSQVKM
jgi:uncharacterized protein (DUF39 family)